MSPKREFQYSVFPNEILSPEGGFTPKPGDFSVKVPTKNFHSSLELECLSSTERRAYNMRWNLKGHPNLYKMIGSVLGCDANEAHLAIQQLSLKVRYHKMLSLN